MKKIKSCGVLLFRRRRHLEFLLMEHAHRLDLPKGHTKKDESEVECALRELKEETGLSPDDVELDVEFRFVLRYRPRGRRYRGKKVRKTLVIFLGWLEGKAKIRPTEHIGHRWVEWAPPHRLQKRTIDPLLACVAEQLDDYLRK